MTNKDLVGILRGGSDYIRFLEGKLAENDIVLDASDTKVTGELLSIRADELEKELKTELATEFAHNPSIGSQPKDKVEKKKGPLLYGKTGEEWLSELKEELNKPLTQPKDEVEEEKFTYSVQSDSGWVEDEKLKDALSQPKNRQKKIEKFNGIIHQDSLEITAYDRWILNTLEALIDAHNQRLEDNE